MAETIRRGQEVAPAEGRAVERHDLRRLLEAERLLGRHEHEIARTRLPALRAIDERASPEAQAIQENAHRDGLELMLDRSMSVAGLEAIGDALDEAIGAPPNECVIEACLAALIDTRVKLPHNLPIYLEALIHDLKDEAYPPAVVAAACQRIRRECVFLPEVSEVLAMCRETSVRYRDQRQAVRTALIDRRQAERWLAQLGGPAPYPAHAGR